MWRSSGETRGDINHQSSTVHVANQIHVLNRGHMLPPMTPVRADSGVSRLLQAAEDASPVQAVEAVTRELRASLGARAVSFLIADLSGRG
jgi:hypothetical protein